MGANKALLQLGDTSCIERVITTARRVTDDIAIVSNEPATYEYLGFPVHPDVSPGFGPLSGIQTALTYCRREWALVLACDLPFVTADLLGVLLEQREGADAVVPRDKDDFLQPLCALYSTRCLSATVELINSDIPAPRLLFDRVKTRILPFTEIAHLDGAEKFFFDIDSPDDYRRALSAKEVRRITK